MDFAHFFAKTFDFEQVYRATVPLAKPGAHYTDIFHMSMRRGDEADVSTYHFESGEVVLALFDVAIQNCDNKQRLEELRRRHPLAVKP